MFIHFCCCDNTFSLKIWKNKLNFFWSEKANLQTFPYGKNFPIWPGFLFEGFPNNSLTFLHILNYSFVKKHHVSASQSKIKEFKPRKIPKHLKSDKTLLQPKNKVTNIYKSYSTNSATPSNNLLSISPTCIRSSSCDERPKSPTPLPLIVASKFKNDRNLADSFGFDSYNSSISSAPRFLKQLKEINISL